MTFPTRIILTLTLSAATALFAGCAADGRSHSHHSTHSARPASNPCADKASASNPCGDKAENPCGDKASTGDGSLDPWGDDEQPAKQDQSTEPAGSWW